jgi:hypothetical protein
MIPMKRTQQEINNLGLTIVMVHEEVEDCSPSMMVVVFHRESSNGVKLWQILSY